MTKKATCPLCEATTVNGVIYHKSGCQNSDPKERRLRRVTKRNSKAKV